MENNQLKISDNDTGDHPLHENVAQFSDQEGYTVQCRAQTYAGYRVEPAQTVPNGWATPTKSVADDHPQIAVVMRYRDDGNMARFRLVDNNTTYYEEEIGGVWSRADQHRRQQCVRRPVAPVADRRAREHEPAVSRRRADRLPRQQRALCNRTDLQVGLSTHNAFAAFDDVRVTRFGLANRG